jgi:hypothetical protein
MPKDDKDLGGDVSRLGLEFLIRAQVQVSRITLSAVGAAAMAFWVTKCCRSRASVAGVAKLEPDVPEAPRARGDGRFPSQDRTCFAILPVTRGF